MDSAADAGYCFLRQDLGPDRRAVELVGHTERSARVRWVAGARFAQPFATDTFAIATGPGRYWPDFFDTTVPVMAPRLVAALRAAGVDNLDAYPVTLRADDGAARTDYVAVNLIGCADAVDRARSPHRLRFGQPYFTGAIHLDATRAPGLAAFRLAHGPAFIVVTAAVATALRSAGLCDVQLQPTTSYDGG